MITLYVRIYLAIPLGVFIFFGPNSGAHHALAETVILLITLHCSPLLGYFSFEIKVEEERKGKE